MYKKTIVRLLSSFLTPLLVAMLYGCTAPDHTDSIFFVTSTQFGAKVGADAYQKPTIDIGYNRQEGAIVPTYLQDPGLASIGDPQIEAILDQISYLIHHNGVKESIELANEISEINKKKKVKNSNIIARIKENLATLSKTSKKAKRDSLIVKIDSLIRAEKESYSLTAAYNERAKYIGKETDDGREDAYSVFATFSGQMSGGSSATINEPTGTSTGSVGNASADMEGKIAQSFATGIAAQIWASQGAGIAGGVPNKISVETITDKPTLADSKGEIPKILFSLFNQLLVGLDDIKNGTMGAPVEIVDEAERLHKLINRSPLIVKIPGTIEYYDATGIDLTYTAAHTIGGSGFARVNQYRNELNHSADSIDTILKDANSTEGGNPITPSRRGELLKARDKTYEDLNRLNKDIASDPAVREILTFLISSK